MALFNQFFPQQSRNNSSKQIDFQQFKQLAVTLDRDSLQKLVQQARQKGLSDKDIEEGLNFILNLQR